MPNTPHNDLERLVFMVTCEEWPNTIDVIRQFKQLGVAKELVAETIRHAPDADQTTKNALLLAIEVIWREAE